MALLEQPGSRVETADCRFFVVNQFKTERLQVAATSLIELSAVCRQQKPSDRAIYKQPIKFVTSDVGRRISEHDGLVIIGGLKGGLQQRRLEEFEVEPGVHAVPVDVITALEPNPGWYGDGHDVHPVINLRIKSRQDFGGVYPLQDEGRWSQVSLETGSIALAEFLPESS